MQLTIGVDLVCEREGDYRLQQRQISESGGRTDRVRKGKQETKAMKERYNQRKTKGAELLKGRWK